MNQRWRIPRPQGATFQAAPDGSVYMVFDDKNSAQVLRDLFHNMNQLEEQVAAWAAAPQPAAQSSGGPNGVFGPGAGPLTIQPPSIAMGAAGMAGMVGGGPNGQPVQIRPPPPPGSHLTPAQSNANPPPNTPGLAPMPQPGIMAPPPPPAGMNAPTVRPPSAAERPTMHAPQILGQVAFPSRPKIRPRVGAMAPEAAVARLAERERASLPTATAIVTQQLVIEPPAAPAFLPPEVVAAKIAEDRAKEGPPVSQVDGRPVMSAMRDEKGAVIAPLPQPGVLAPPPPPRMNLVDGSGNPIRTGG